MNDQKTNPVECGHECQLCGGKIVNVEYSYASPNHYDGISEIACSNAMGPDATCTYRKGRFCGETLLKGESEPPFCKGGPHHKSK